MLYNSIRHLPLILAICASSTHTFAHPDHTPPSNIVADFGISQSVEQEIHSLETKIAADPSDTVSMSRLGGVLLKVARKTAKHADYLRAEMVFERMSKANPDSVNALLGLAYSKLGQHKFAEALKVARHARIMKPDSMNILSLMGDVHLSLGNLTEAQLIFDSVAADSLTLESLSRQALVYAARSQNELAMTTMEEALQAGELLEAPNGQIAWCQSMLGEYALNAGDLDTAEERFNSALELSPKMHHAKWKLVEVMIRRGQLEEAETEMIKIAAEYPKPRYLTRLGEIHLMHGDEADLRDAAKLFKRSSDIMEGEIANKAFGHTRELVEFILDHGSDTARAVQLAQYDLENIRHDPQGYETLAWAYHMNNQDDLAVEQMEIALKLAPNTPRALYRASMIAQSMGNTQEASRLMDRARNLDQFVDITCHVSPMKHASASVSKEQNG